MAGRFYLGFFLSNTPTPIGIFNRTEPSPFKLRFFYTEKKKLNLTKHFCAQQSTALPVESWRSGFLLNGYVFIFFIDFPDFFFHGEVLATPLRGGSPKTLETKKKASQQASPKTQIL